jgi:hypothetical protein
MKLWTTGRSWPMVHRGPSGVVVALLGGDGRAFALVLGCSPQLHREKEEVEQSSQMTKDDDGLRIQANSSGERRWPWMLIEIGFSSRDAKKWVPIGYLWGNSLVYFLYYQNEMMRYLSSFERVLG